MIDLKFLKGLIRAIDESGIDSIEISRGGTRIRLAKTPPYAAGANTTVGSSWADQRPNPAGATAVVEAGGARAGAGAGDGAAAAAEVPASEGVAAAALVEVRSPMVGTFYRAPAPDAPPYVEVGSRVSKGDTLCVIEAMKLMNELESEVDGVVAEICVENADPVEYGQVLFRIRPL